MRRLLIALAVGWGIGGAAAARAQPVPDEPAPTRWHFGGGLGLDVAGEREVNPEFGDTRVAPSLFAVVRRGDLGLLVEGSRAAPRVTASGGLKVESARRALGAWARYRFAAPYGAGLFVAAGGGAHFDRVRTTFANAVDERVGTRRFGGLGVGLSQTAWSIVLGEVEARVIGTEGARAAGFALDLRLGLTF